MRWNRSCRIRRSRFGSTRTGSSGVARALDTWIASNRRTRQGPVRLGTGIRCSRCLRHSRGESIRPEVVVSFRARMLGIGSSAKAMPGTRVGSEKLSERIMMTVLSVRLLARVPLIWFASELYFLASSSIVSWLYPSGLSIIFGCVRRKKLMAGPLLVASPSALHSCGASPQDFAHSYPHAPGTLSVHVNEHSSVMLIAAAIMRVTLPIIVFTLRNGRHQWNGMTQRRPSTNCSIRQITVSQISIVMVPSTNA